jgi:hypothetical protein
MAQANFPLEVVQAVLGQLAAVGPNENASSSGDVAVFFMPVTFLCRL